MEKEIRELIHQRDLAQSRLRDLLSSVGDDLTSRRSGESSQLSVHHQPVASEDESSISEASSICYQTPELAISKFKNSYIPRQNTRSQSGSLEDECREVQCIEVDDLPTKTDESSLLLDKNSDILPLPITSESKLKDFSGRPDNASTGSSSEMRQNPNGNYEEMKKDASTETLLSSSESPSQRSLEFKKQQREIIELWDSCDVSLIHRTYFFLLFKGEPTDSMYMEVEHRRLYFLKRVLSQGNETGTVNSSAFNLKNLRHERAMLHRRIQNKLSSEERNHLYIKWGIKMSSKQRSMQLAKLLWTDTKDITCVKESALLVAKLIGLKPELALKEMFGLSFMPRECRRRTFRWNLMSSFR